MPKAKRPRATSPDPVEAASKRARGTELNRFFRPKNLGEVIFLDLDNAYPFGLHLYRCTLDHPIRNIGDTRADMRFDRCAKYIVKFLRRAGPLSLDQIVPTAICMIRDRLVIHSESPYNVYVKIMTELSVLFDADPVVRGEFQAFDASVVADQGASEGGYYRERVDHWTRLTDRKSPFPFALQCILSNDSLGMITGRSWYCMLWHAVSFPAIRKGLFAMLVVRLALWDLVRDRIGGRSGCIIGYCIEGLRILVVHDADLRDRMWISPIYFSAVARDDGDTGKRRFYAMIDWHGSYMEPEDVCAPGEEKDEELNALMRRD